jgi:hypothetical protein
VNLASSEEALQTLRANLGPGNHDRGETARDESGLGVSSWDVTAGVSHFRPPLRPSDLVPLGPGVPLFPGWPMPAHAKASR